MECAYLAKKGGEWQQVAAGKHPLHKWRLPGKKRVCVRSGAFGEGRINNFNQSILLLREGG